MSINTETVISAKNINWRGKLPLETTLPTFKWYIPGPDGKIKKEDLNK